MYFTTFLSILFILLAPWTFAVPLNINLGAYSPALVVGDGEISFGGGEANGAAQSAAQLMETLATGAVGAANGNANAQPQAAAPAAEGQPQAAGSAGGEGAAGGEQPGKAATPAGAEDATTTDPAAASSTTSADPAATSQPATENKAAITKKVLQAVPKAKRAQDEDDGEEKDDLEVRDIQGFRESLGFAERAMKNTPEINLGTEKSGVGILQSPGINVPKGSPAAGVAARNIDEQHGKRGITLLAIAEI